MSRESIREEIRGQLEEEIGATSRRSWNMDAVYAGGRMFLAFDGDDLVGKWAPERRAELVAAGIAERPFMDGDDPATAMWWRVPLSRLQGPDDGVALALESLGFVQSPAGAPKGRKRRRGSGPRPDPSGETGEHPAT